MVLCSQPLLARADPTDPSGVEDTIIHGRDCVRIGDSASLQVLLVVVLLMPLCCWWWWCC